MELIESLKILGLEEKEAKVYLALLQLGKTTAYNVAIRANLKRPTVYLMLNQLVEKGFARLIPKAKKRFFVAESFELCLKTAQERMNLAAEKAAEFRAIENKKKDKEVSVAYYEGMRGIGEMYQRLIKVLGKKPLSKREFVAFHARTKDTPPELIKHFEYLFEEAYKKKGIRIKSITVYEPDMLKKWLNSEYLKKVNITSKGIDVKKYSSQVSITVYDHYVQIFSHRYLRAVVIDNLDVAQALKQIFFMVWNLVDKDKDHYLKYSTEGK